MRPTENDKQIEIHSERGYDALLSGWHLVRRVAAGGPSSLEAIAAAEGRAIGETEQQLASLVRSQVLQFEGDRYRLPAANVYSVRQEGMVAGLSRYVLPLITELANDGDGHIEQIDLPLSVEAQRALRGGLVQRLLEELSSISDRESEMRRPHRAVIVGTSDLPSTVDPRERYLEAVRRCARQRATADRDRASLLHYDALIGLEHAPAAVEALRRAAAELADMGSERVGEKATYTMILAFGAGSVEQGVES